MKAILISLLSLGILIGVFATSSGPESAQQATNANRDVTYASVLSAVDDGAAFVDVRTPAEYYESHYVGAELFPLQELQQGKLPAYDTDTPLYVYCRSGNRTKEAAAVLRRAGYEVIDLGGLQDVGAIGGELTRDTCPLGDAQLCINQFSVDG